MSSSALAQAVADVDRALRAHAGGVELVSEDDGEVELRFTGMCTGCAFKPQTMAVTIRPALLAVEGVREVRAAGARTSVEAEQRMAAFFLSA